MHDDFPRDIGTDPDLPPADLPPADLPETQIPATDTTEAEPPPEVMTAEQMPAEEMIEAESPEELPEPPKDEQQPALVINIHSWATPIVGIVMLVVGLAAGYLGRPYLANLKPAETQAASQEQTSGQVSQEQSPASTPTLMEYLVGQTRHFQGDQNAPVTLIEFSDFQCPYCGKFATETEQQIYDQYIKTGKLRFGYIHFTFLGQESQWAAEASECANDQNAFWPYHDYLFAHQSGENLGAFNKDNLKKFAVALNLNAEQFNQCLDSGKYTDLVKSQTSMAQNLGVSSTPTMVINGKVLLGAQPFATFQQVIDSDLPGQ
jgi:protein-disulfide isomerase